MDLRAQQYASRGDLPDRPVERDRDDLLALAHRVVDSDDWAMYTPQGNEAVRQAVIELVATVWRRSGRAGFDARTIADLIERMHERVEAAGFREVYDTAVREVLHERIKDALGLSDAVEDGKIPYAFDYRGVEGITVPE